MSSGLTGVRWFGKKNQQTKYESCEISIKTALKSAQLLCECHMYITAIPN